MAPLLFGVLIAIALFMALSWWSHTDTQSAKRTLFWASVGLAGLLGLGLLATGKGLFAVVPVGYTIWRLLGLSGGGGGSGPQQNGTSTGSSNGARGGGRSDLSRADALEVLGLQDPVTDDEVVAAHRRLIAKAHPDAGGSKWMAAQINAARDVLLGP